MLGDRYAIIDDTVSAEASTDIDLDDPREAAQAALLSKANNNAALFTQTPFFKAHLATKR